MNLRNRLRRLERDAGAAGCPACRDLRGLVVVRRVRHGTSLPWEEPAPCPRCREVPEQILEIEEVVVTTREEVAQLKGLNASESSESTGLPRPVS
jgi:hypothetical protein